MLRSRRRWPNPSFEEVVKRSRILVIDDKDFPYLPLFRRDGYSITKWNSVKSLAELENSTYDIILLDLHGVARHVSANDGLGVLEHIRTASPHQIVIAYSSEEFPLKYQKFFDMADEVLSKTADFTDFKRSVDNLLTQRFALGFYVDRAFETLGDEANGLPGFQKRFERAALTGDLDGLRAWLMKQLNDQEKVNRVVTLASAAATVASIWMS